MRPATSESAQSSFSNSSRLRNSNVLWNPIPLSEPTSTHSTSLPQGAKNHRVIPLRPSPPVKAYTPPHLLHAHAKRGTTTTTPTSGGERGSTGPGAGGHPNTMDLSVPSRYVPPLRSATSNASPSSPYASSSTPLDPSSSSSSFSSSSSSSMHPRGTGHHPSLTTPSTPLQNGADVKVKKGPSSSSQEIATTVVVRSSTQGEKGGGMGVPMYSKTKLLQIYSTLFRSGGGEGGERTTLAPEQEEDKEKADVMKEMIFRDLRVLKSHEHVWSEEVLPPTATVPFNEVEEPLIITGNIHPESVPRKSTISNGRNIPSASSFQTKGKQTGKLSGNVQTSHSGYAASFSETPIEEMYVKTSSHSPHGPNAGVSSQITSTSPFQLPMSSRTPPLSQSVSEEVDNEPVIPPSPWSSYPSLDPMSLARNESGGGVESGLKPSNTSDVSNMLTGRGEVLHPTGESQEAWTPRTSTSSTSSLPVSSSSSSIRDPHDPNKATGGLVTTVSSDPREILDPRFNNDPSFYPSSSYPTVSPNPMGVTSSYFLNMYGRSSTQPSSSTSSLPLHSTHASNTYPVMPTTAASVPPMGHPSSVSSPSVPTSYMTPNSIFNAASHLSSLPSTSYHIDTWRATAWFYRDPQGYVQGPFESTMMQDWYRNNYFSNDLPIQATFKSTMTGHTVNSGEFLPLLQFFHKFCQGDLKTPFLNAIVTETLPIPPTSTTMTATSNTAHPHASGTTGTPTTLATASAPLPSSISLSSYPFSTPAVSMTTATPWPGQPSFDTSTPWTASPYLAHQPTFSSSSASASSSLLSTEVIPSTLNAPSSTSQLPVSHDQVPLSSVGMSTTSSSSQLPYTSSHVVSVSSSSHALHSVTEKPMYSTSEEVPSPISVSAVEEVSSFHGRPSFPSHPHVDRTFSSLPHDDFLVSTTVPSSSTTITQIHEIESNEPTPMFVPSPAVLSKNHPQEEQEEAEKMSAKKTMKPWTSSTPASSTLVLKKEKSASKDPIKNTTSKTNKDSSSSKEIEKHSLAASLTPISSTLSKVNKSDGVQEEEKVVSGGGSHKEASREKKEKQRPRSTTALVNSGEKRVEKDQASTNLSNLELDFHEHQQPSLCAWDIPTDPSSADVWNYVPPVPTSKISPTSISSINSTTSFSSIPSSSSSSSSTSSSKNFTDKLAPWSNIHVPKPNMTQLLQQATSAHEAAAASAAAEAAMALKLEVLQLQQKEKGREREKEKEKLAFSISGLGSSHLMLPGSSSSSKFGGSKMAWNSVASTSKALGIQALSSTRVSSSPKVAASPSSSSPLLSSSKQASPKSVLDSKKKKASNEPISSHSSFSNSLTKSSETLATSTPSKPTPRPMSSSSRSSSSSSPLLIPGQVSHPTLPSKKDKMTNSGNKKITNTLPSSSSPLPSTSTVTNATASSKKMTSSLSEALTKWTRHQLKSLSGIQFHELMAMFSGFPVDNAHVQETQVTIMSLVLDFSTSLDGRVFASEFTRRRRLELGYSDDVHGHSSMHGRNVGGSALDVGVGHGGGSVHGTHPSGFQVVGSKNKVKKIQAQPPPSQHLSHNKKALDTTPSSTTTKKNTSTKQNTSHPTPHSKGNLKTAPPPPPPTTTTTSSSTPKSSKSKKK
ncbi:hypothetical protein HMI55_003029 [Coelomomyces lativittatus]|nr:hypothetical protein HMI55_003029 [Coelomomyces lativittatus]